MQAEKLEILRNRKAERAELKARIEIHLPAAIETRTLAITPDVWPGSNEDGRKLSKARIMAADEILPGLAESLRTAKARLLAVDAEIESLEDDRREEERQGRSMLAYALYTANVRIENGAPLDVASFSAAASAKAEELVGKRAQAQLNQPVVYPQARPPRIVTNNQAAYNELTASEPEIPF